MPERTLANGTVVEFPETMTADQIDAVIAKKNAEGAGSRPVASHEAKDPLDLGEGIKSLGRLVRQNPGATGATLGGIIGSAGGPLGAIGGAYIGGAGGRGFGIADEALNQGKVSPSFMDDWKDMAWSGTIGAAQEAVAGPLSRLVPYGAGKLYKSLLGPSKAITSEFGDVAAQGLERSLPIGRMTGVDAADAALTESTQAARNMVAGAEKAGVPNIHAKEIIPELRGVRDELQLRADTGQSPDMSAALGERARTIRDAIEGVPQPVGRGTSFSPSPGLPPGVRGSPPGGGTGVLSPTSPVSLSPRTMVSSHAYGPGGLPAQTAVPGPTIMARPRTGITPTRTQALKESAQDAFHGAQRQVEAGTAKELGPQDLMNRSVARGYQKALETRIPGLQAQNANSQELIGVLKALREAVERGDKRLPLGGGRDVAAIMAGLGTGAATGNAPAGVATAAMTRLLSSPFAGSLLAILGHHGGKYIPAAMRTGRMGIAALNTDDEEPEP